jgi:hypothetical protein
MQPILSLVAVMNVEHDLVEPGSQIRSQFKSVKRPPGLQVSFLNQVFSFGSVAAKPQRNAEKLVGKTERLRLKRLKLQL